MKKKNPRISKEIKKFSTTKTFKKLNEINVWKGLGQIFIDWLGIFVSIFICIKFWCIPLYLITTLFIASRIQGLSTTLHDAMHYRLVKNKNLNDLFANILICIPTFISLTEARKQHKTHHDNTNDIDHDPDLLSKVKGRYPNEWIFPKSKFGLFFTFLKYTFGIHLIMILFKRDMSIKEKFIYILKSLSFQKFKINFKEKVTYITILFHIITIACMIYFGFFSEYLLFWIAPTIFWAPFFGRLRAISEHFNVKDTNQYNESSVLILNWFDKLFLTGTWNIQYHTPHHIYPYVPSYNLKKLHEEMLKLNLYRKHVHITEGGYIELFKNCLKN